ncbi:MAG: hypothetical protein U0V75_05870 [Ferruginibacter sp.]
MLRYCCLFILLVQVQCSLAQSGKIDSLKRLLQNGQQDTSRVTLLWKLAEQYQFFKPDTTLQLAQQAYLQAKHIKYTEGESRSLAVMATGQYLLGNYTEALKNYTLKLQIEEKRNSSRNYASALNNIGLMYILLADYPNALRYLYKADSTIQLAGAAVKKETHNQVLTNLGETYYRMKKGDSAFFYFSQVLQNGISSGDAVYQGAAMLGLGNVLAAEGQDSAALKHYKNALTLLNDGANNDMVCETAQGLANVFYRTKQPDSALHYARIAFSTGKKDGFLSRELDAAGFLSRFYKDKKKYDSAFVYMEQSVMLQDSLKGQAKTREAMIISSNEQLRQAELAEQKQLEKETRIQQLQILGICIFIPLFFLVTLAVSRIRVHRNIVRFMGVVSLLLFFEFLVLLLHPLIGELTHHNKVLELLILVVIGAGLVPLHHKMERLVITKLTKPLLPKMKDTAAANTDEYITAAEPPAEEVLTALAQQEAPAAIPDETAVQKKSAPADDATEADKQ